MPEPLISRRTFLSSRFGGDFGGDFEAVVFTAGELPFPPRKASDPVHHLSQGVEREVPLGVMARRKTNRNNAGAHLKGKGPMNRRHVFAGDRNRASPAPIIKLCKGLTVDQKDAIIAMGHRSFLDIKCEQLHNPVINWFAQCYHPDRRAFVIPCRGTIPLTEESVYLMTGLPRGQLEVKYYVDYVLESELAGRIFPGESSRPKVSDIGRRIEQYNGVDDTFKELWMLFLMSTVIAPTTDTRMSNKCYPMLRDIGEAHNMNLCKFVVDNLHECLSNRKYTKGCLLYCMLRYFSALDTDHLELELGDDLELGNVRFAINRWSKVAVDVIGDMDAQEHDATSFGSMKLRDEFKDDFARELGLFGGSEGFNAWMNVNIHPTCTGERRNKVFSLMQAFASSLNGLLSNFIQGLTESTCEVVKNDHDDDDGEDSNGDDLLGSSSSEEEHERPVEPPRKQKHVKESHQPRKEGRKVSPRKQIAAPPASNEKVELTTAEGKGEGATIGETGNVKPMEVILEATPSNEKGDSSNSFPIPPMHSQIAIPSDSEKDMSDGSEGISGYMSDSTLHCTQRAEEQIRGSAACLAARLSKKKQQPIAPSLAELEMHTATKLVVARELGIPIGLHADEIEQTKLVNDNTDSKEHIPEDRVEVAAHSVNVKSSSKRKRESTLNTPPSRKSPRLALLSDGKNSSSAVLVSQTTCKTPKASKVSTVQKKPSFSDGKSKKSAIDISPTASKSPPDRVGIRVSAGLKNPADSDGKSKESAISISPTATVRSVSKSTSSGDGKSKRSAIEISPSVQKLHSEKHAPSKNMCRSMVLSPVAKGTGCSDRGSSSIPWKLSPLAMGCLGIPGFHRGSPVKVTREIEQLVKSLSETVNKEGILSRFGKQKSSSTEGVSRKRKHVDAGGTSSNKIRDNRMGMFTPPPFDLGISSPENLCGESSPECVGTQEDAVPMFAINAAPIAWAKPQEGPSILAGKTFSYAGPSKLPGKTMEVDNVKGSSKFVQEADDDCDIEEFQFSKEVQDFFLNKVEVLSEKGADELNKYEKYCAAFSKRRRELEAAAAPQTNLDGSVVQSITPRVNPHKARVKNASRFLQSPFDGSLKVTGEQEEVYQKIMLSSRNNRPSKSNLKKYQIIKYTDSWVFTGDLADSVHVRGELSNHCMEVGIEYMRRTNNVEGKLIMPYQLTDFLITGQFEKKIVVSYFKRTATHSLSVMKQISFPVLEEVKRGNKEGNHWYCLSMNFQAGRFEVLDSLRGEWSESLITHANALISSIKAIWQIHYVNSKVQIQNWELMVVNVPTQENIFNCGFHVLYNIEKWDGQNIPQIGKEDVFKLRRIMPHKWITADFNEEKENWRWNLYNNAIRK